MKLGSKFISTLAAIALMGSCTALPAYACSNCNPPTNEVHGMGNLPIDPVEDRYTLDELFAMSDEDFMSLDDDLEYIFEIMMNDINELLWTEDDGTKRFGALTGVMQTLLKKEDIGVKYVANVTESEIQKLLGDKVKYEITSPLLNMNIWDWEDSDYVHYGNLFCVGFPDYLISRTETPQATEADVMEFLKCLYCVNQVIEVPYMRYGYVLGAAPDCDPVLTGDVNLDKKVDAADAEHMKKALSGEFTLTEDQLKIADYNGDGKFDALDAEKIINDVAYSVPTDVEPTKYGDVTGDKKISISDAVCLNMFLLDSEQYPLTDVQKVNSDCVRDGVIDSSDCTLLMNYIAEIVEISELGK